MSADRQEWPLYEVFIRSKSGLSHKHAGSIHAADDQMALDHARDVAQAVIDRRQDGQRPARRRRVSSATTTRRSLPKCRIGSVPGNRLSHSVLNSGQKASQNRGTRSASRYSAVSSAVSVMKLLPFALAPFWYPGALTSFS